MTLEQEVLNLDGSDAELFYERMAETASICSSRTRPFPHSWTQAIAEIFSVGSDDAGSSTSLSVFTFIMSSPAVRQREQKDKKTPASASTSPRLDSNLNGILKDAEWHVQKIAAMQPQSERGTSFVDDSEGGVRLNLMDDDTFAERASKAWNREGA